MHFQGQPKFTFVGDKLQLTYLARSDQLKHMSACSCLCSTQPRCVLGCWERNCTRNRFLNEFRPIRKCKKTAEPLPINALNPSG